MHKLLPSEHALMRHDTPHQQAGQAVNEGWVHGGAFLASVLSGTLLGYLADRWLDTDPWLVVVGILLGSYSGFMNLWYYAKRMEQRSDER